MSAWTGGLQVGDRYDNGHDYYPMKFNKGAVAFTKGALLSVDPANGNLRLAATGHTGPFYIAYEDSLVSDNRVHVWKQEGVWLVQQTTTALLPNAIVVPSTTESGKIGTIAAASRDTAVGIYLGTVDLGADLTSGDVKQDSADANDLVVIEFRKV